MPVVGLIADFTENETMGLKLTTVLSYMAHFFLRLTTGIYRVVGDAECNYITNYIMLLISNHTGLTTGGGRTSKSHYPNYSCS